MITQQDKESVMRILNNDPSVQKAFKGPGDKPNLLRVTLAGSHSYGVANEDSDYDIYVVGFEDPFQYVPFMNATIPALDKPFKLSTIHLKSYKLNGKPVEFNIYGLANYLSLVTECNPNMVETLYSPEECVIFETTLGRWMQQGRSHMVSKKIFHTTKGYANSQRNKLLNKQAEGNRVALIEQYGHDTKFAYHYIRILMQGINCLESAGASMYPTLHQIQTLKDIREGKVSKEEVVALGDELFEILVGLNETSSLVHDRDMQWARRVWVQAYMKWLSETETTDRTKVQIGFDYGWRSS